MRYKNVNIIGTSHIAKQSLKEVKEFIEGKKPEIIALELDHKRLYALTHKEKGKISLYNIRRVGLKGFLFSLIGAWAEKKLGQIVNVEPGSEMKLAVKLAKNNDSKIVLIDQDIEITLRRLSSSITFKEKWNFLVDILKSTITKKPEINIDLNKVPEKELIKKLMDQVKERYPNIYKVLVEERNQIMASKLSQIMDQNPEKLILAVVGAGHEEGIIDIMNKPDISFSVSFG